MNLHSIRFRLISWYAGLLTALFIFLGVSGFLGLRYYLEEVNRATLTRRARVIARMFISEINLGESYVIEDILKHYSPEANDRFFRITRGDGSILFVSGLPKDGSFDPAFLPPLQVPVSKSFLREEPGGGRGGVLIYTLPLTLSDKREFLLEVGVSSRQIEDPLKGMLIALGLCFPVVVAVAIFGGYLLVGRVLKPVDEMTKSAERITSRNLSERLPIAKTGDELEGLSISLNNMIIRLEEAFHHISRFSADASHELRTPLTILHCELEAIIQKPEIAPEIRENIGSSLEETERLAKIIDGLLAISRMDAGEARMEMSALDFAKLVSVTVEQMRLLAEDKEISLICRITDQIHVEGDCSRLKQVIVNLLDNAIKYTPKGGTVLIDVFTKSNMCVLEVSDTGIGVPADALPHVFERFYRADKARSRQMGGAGLGLSIVKSICTAHNGQVTVQATEGKGSCFRVELPLTKTPVKNIEKVVVEV